MKQSDYSALINAQHPSNRIPFDIDIFINGMCPDFFLPLNHTDFTFYLGSIDLLQQRFCFFQYCFGIISFGATSIYSGPTVIWI